MDYLHQIIGDIETHNLEGIRTCFENGVSPNALFRGEALIYELTSEYLRSNRFAACVRLFVEYGLEMEDKVLLAVLLNDANGLAALLDQDPDKMQHTYTLRAAFTPLEQVSLLHLCAEYNHVACAEILLSRGLDVNVPAGKDGLGFGGQTPIFHTVNQILNQSKEMLDLLLANGADCEITVRGIVWGKSYDWETFIPAVNPISYAGMALLPQMHRDPRTTAQTISKLMHRTYGITYELPNVPNKYLD